MKTFANLLFVFTLVLTLTGCGETPKITNTDDKSIQDESFESYKALVLIDKRLYSLLKSETEEYISLAQKRRNFEILLDSNKELDDYTYSDIKNLIINYKSQYPAIEGVLFVGNIKLPSFYKSRNDNNQIRPFLPFYEDLDLNLTRYYGPGAIDPQCPTNTPYCYGWGSYQVPEHDFDDIVDYRTEPDIWTSYMPVGGVGTNSYNDFADQLRPYFIKLINFYNEKYSPQKSLYALHGNIGEFILDFWDVYGNVTDVDFFAMNPDMNDPNSDPGCMTGGRTAQQCYVRAPLEKFTSYTDFVTEYNKREPMGDGWQNSEVYKQHMTNNNYEFVIVNVHSWEGESLITSEEARKLKNGGMIMFGFGCSVAGFEQPNSPSNIISVPVHDNILLSYLYGTSNSLAAAGAPFNRGHYGHFHDIIVSMKKNQTYLGKTHFERMKTLYAHANSSYDIKEEINEILFGDPFLDTIDNGPDLIVTDLEFTPQNPAESDYVHIVAKVKNKGQKASGVVNIKWYIDGKQVGYGSFGPMQPGATVPDYSDNVRMDWQTVGGGHTIGYEIDADNMEKEKFEFNNKFEKTIFVECPSGKIEFEEHCVEPFDLALRIADCATIDTDCDGDGVTDIFGCALDGATVALAAENKWNTFKGQLVVNSGESSEVGDAPAGRPEWINFKRIPVWTEKPDYTTDNGFYRIIVSKDGYKNRTGLVGIFGKAGADLYWSKEFIGNYICLNK